MAMDGYTIVTCIGKGSSGAVYLARSDKIKKLVAIKKIEIDESRRSRCRKSVIREANILRTLNHYHIVKCYEWFLEEQGADISMVLEYCNGGTLQDRITSAQKNKTQLSEEKVLEWTMQITSAVNYIHERRILHRDLKSENVFLLKSDVVKLGDFGISKEIDHTLDKASTCVGTPCYLSPELCQDIPYSFKSDIWALGCLLFEMCALKPAFDAANLISLFYKIVNGKYSPLPDSCSQPLKDLVSKILVRNPDARPTASQLLKLPILQKYVNKVRLRSPESTSENNVAKSTFKPAEKNVDKWGDLDDLDDLLQQTEEELTNGPFNNVGAKTQARDITSGRSFSVYGEYGLHPADVDGADANEASRPQTCPHSAVTRESTCTPTDTIATWSGYGDRCSRRPSGRRNLSSSSEESDQLSDYNSDADSVVDKVDIQRNYTSDEFSSYSEDEDHINTARTTVTIDEEIPEVIEDCNDAETSEGKFANSSNLVSMGGTRNLPGSAWLQSKRAQVLRQKQDQGHRPVIVSTVQRQNSNGASPYTGSSCSNYTDKNRTNLQPLQNMQTLDVNSDKQRRRKQRLPGSSWLKHNSRSSSEEIILGEKDVKTSRRKHKNLPGSGWLLGREKQDLLLAKQTPPKPATNKRKDLVLESLSCESSPEKHFSGSDTNRSAYDADYPDDFEDYDDDFDLDVDDEFDRTKTLTRHVSSLEVVKQGCIDTIGQEAYDRLSVMFKKGLSIGEAYERCRDTVDFETLETCYLLLN